MKAGFIGLGTMGASMAANLQKGVQKDGHTARALDYVMYNHGAQVAYCSNFDKLPQSMKEVRPTVFVGVPRVYEKIRDVVQQRAASKPALKLLRLDTRWTTPPRCCSPRMSPPRSRA